jgi:hypothetical protein
MTRFHTFICAFVALLLSALAPAPANAFNCLGDHKPFQLAGDSIEYSMKIAPGADCIQGLRWSFMQIYTVWVLEKPKHGELVMVGPGFRYKAKAEYSGEDKFTLVVVGKNRHEEGFSTVEIAVSASKLTPAPGVVRQAPSVGSAKLADAAAGR